MADLGILAAEIPTELANRIPNQPTHVSVNLITEREWREVHILR